MSRRSKSSGRWLAEHFSDPFVQQAKDKGLRSRAAFKLEEIDRAEKLISPGAVIVDLGAAPGGWSQYAARRLAGRGAVFALDLLAMDAFSGDSIPAHLLTLEAMQTYLRHLKPDGILAVHITNRYLDLKPVMAAAASHFGRTTLLYALEPDKDDDFCYSADWVLIMSPERAKALPLVMNDVEPLEVLPGFRPWTDSFSNLFSVLK